MNAYAEMSREDLLHALSDFARTLDERIRTTCLHCPPDAPEGLCCGWEFTLGDQTTDLH
jgi:hypothetical protein